MGHDSKIAEAMLKIPGIKQFMNSGKWMGETSELWTRLALRNRVLKNQMAETGATNPYEATWKARNYLDFYQGGRVAKAIDQFVPYFNASVQGARGIGRAAIERPGLMAWKMANIGVLSSGLFLWNHLKYPEIMRQVSQNTQENYWILNMLPESFSYTDQAGNKKQLLVKIPKDQFSRVVCTLFESALAKYLHLDGDTYDTSNFGQAFANFLPIVQGQNFPPALKAYFGVFNNKDLWRQQDIWKGPKVSAQEEYYTGRMGRDPTHPLLVQWGKLSGTSPVRTGYALEQFFTGTNPFVMAPVEMLRAGTGGLNNKEREILFTEVLARTPALNRFIATTSPYSAYGEKTSQYAEDANTRALIRRRNLDEMAETYYRNPIKENMDVIKRYIKEQDPEERKSLIDRFKLNKQLYDLPDRDWWLHTYSLPTEAKAQAFLDKYKTLDEEGQRHLLQQAVHLRGYGGTKFRYELRKLMRGGKSDASGG
jgi:hypothetical protein